MNSTCTCLFCSLVGIFCHYSSQGLLSPGSEPLDRLQAELKSKSKKLRKISYNLDSSYLNHMLFLCPRSPLQVILIAACSVNSSNFCRAFGRSWALHLPTLPCWQLPSEYIFFSCKHMAHLPKQNKPYYIYLYSIWP